MKKLLLGLGTIVITIIPITIMVSCGKENKQTVAADDRFIKLPIEDTKQTTLNIEQDRINHLISQGARATPDGAVVSEMMVLDTTAQAKYGIILGHSAPGLHFKYKYTATASHIRITAIMTDSHNLVPYHLPIPIRLNFISETNMHDKLKLPLLLTPLLNNNDLSDYGLVLQDVNDPNGFIQRFYHDNTNLKKFKAAFPSVEGILTATSTNISGVANTIESLPDGFLIPYTVTNLGYFGTSLTSLPQNFVLPSFVADIGDFGSSLISISPNFTLKDTAVNHLGVFGQYLTHLPENFSLPSTVTNLGTFGSWLESLPEDFSLPSAITDLGRFGSSLISLPDGFSIPPTVTELKEFGESLTSLHEHFTLQNTIITDMSTFGWRLTSLPQGFQFPPTITNLGTFGVSLTSLPRGFKLPQSNMHLDKYFCQSLILKPMQHLLLLDGTEILSNRIAYIRNSLNEKSWYIGNKVGQSYAAYLIEHSIQANDVHQG